MNASGCAGVVQRSHQWVTKDFDALWSRHEPAVRKKIEAELAISPPPTSDPLFREWIVETQIASSAEEAMRVARDGLTELLCDAVGVHLFGPAAAAALLEFSARFSLDTDPQSTSRYPPWRYRLRQVAEQCRDDLAASKTVFSAGLPDCIRDFATWLSDIDKIAAITTDQDIIDCKAVTSEPYRVIREEWHRVLQAVIELIPDSVRDAYRLSERADIIRSLVTRLEEGVPPNELGTWPNSQPADLADILNAAWVYKVGEVKKSSHWGSMQQFGMLYRLVLKAIESSHVHRRYASRMPGSAP